MPDPKKFDNKRDWMDNCMHQLRREEGKEQDESVAQCLNQWRDKNKKKARRVVASFLEAADKESGIWTEEKPITRLKERLRPRQKSIHQPAEKGTPFAKPGEIVTVIDPQSGKEINKPYDPVKMKDKVFEEVKS